MRRCIFRPTQRDHHHLISPGRVTRRCTFRAVPFACPRPSAWMEFSPTEPALGVRVSKASGLRVCSWARQQALLSRNRRSAGRPAVAEYRIGRQRPQQPENSRKKCIIRRKHYRRTMTAPANAVSTAASPSPRLRIQGEGDGADPRYVHKPPDPCLPGSPCDLCGHYLNNAAGAQNSFARQWKTRVVARLNDATLFDPCSLDVGSMHRSRAIRRPYIRYFLK